jgi:hypothetical protein
MPRLLPVLLRRTSIELRRRRALLYIRGVLCPRVADAYITLRRLLVGSLLLDISDSHRGIALGVRDASVAK